jgi:hypothetical protein
VVPGNFIVVPYADMMAGGLEFHEPIEVGGGRTYSPYLLNTSPNEEPRITIHDSALSKSIAAFLKHHVRYYCGTVVSIEPIKVPPSWEPMVLIRFKNGRSITMQLRGAAILCHAA